PRSQAGPRPAAHLPVRGSDKAQVLRQGAGPEVVGLPQGPVERTGPGRAGRLPLESQLPADLPAGADRGRVPRSRVVPLVHSGGAGADYSETPDWRGGRGGISGGYLVSARGRLKSELQLSDPAPPR